MADENLIAERKRTGGRKRKFPDQNESIRKQLYNTNQIYYRKDGVRVDPKVFKFITDCCVRICHSKLNRNKQSQAFQTFYGLGSFELRSSFINSCVSEVEPARRTRKDESEYSRRGFTKIYTLSNERVCKTLFCNILQISSKRVETSLKKLRYFPETDQISTAESIQTTRDEATVERIVQKQLNVLEHGDDQQIDNTCKDAAVMTYGDSAIETYYIKQDEDQSAEYLEDESYTIEEEPEIIEIKHETRKEFDENFVCSCPNGCTDKLPLKTRRQLFQMFWNIGTNLDRNAFVNCCVSENLKPSAEEIPTRKFFLKGVEICEPTFTKTLMITSDQIDSSLQGNEESDEEIDPKEKVAAHIRGSFKIEPLLQFMCSNFVDENPDCPVSDDSYIGQFNMWKSLNTLSY